MRDHREVSLPIKSAPIVAWEAKLEIMTDQPTKRQTNMRVHREVSLPITSAPIVAWEVKRALVLDE